MIKIASTTRVSAILKKAAEALDYVFGYTPFIDVSARGLPDGFFLGKSWHTFAPMGPTLVTANEIADPNQLQIRLWVNHENLSPIQQGDRFRLYIEAVGPALTVQVHDPLRRSW